MKGSEKEEQKQDFEALAQAARVERGRQASAKIQAILKEYKCTIVPTLTIIGTNIQAGIQIVPQ